MNGDGYKDAACGGADCNDTDATVNPGSSEVCGNGLDENCNGTSDDTCLTCPDGTLLVVKEMEYNQGDEKLQIKGRATAGTSITIINADTKEILAEGISADKGKWEAEIKGVGSKLANITVSTSNGCAVDQQIKVREVREDRKDHNDRKNRDEDDNQNKRDYEKNRH